MKISISKEQDTSKLDGPYKVIDVNDGKNVSLVNENGDKYRLKKNNFDYKTLKYLIDNFSLYCYLDYYKRQYKVKEIVLEI